MFSCHDERSHNEVGLAGKQVIDEPAEYEIRVAPPFSDPWGTWFDGLQVEQDEAGNTVLRGLMIDQAALYGVLYRIRLLNLIILSVERKPSQVFPDNPVK